MTPGAAAPPLGWSSCSRWRPGGACTVSRSSTRCGPGSTWRTPAPRLHKAAHFARRSLGEQTSGVVLRGEMVLLLPDDEVEVDAVRFEADARAALEAGDADAAAAVAGTYGGILLPDDLYEPWTEEARERLRILRADLLRRAGRWEVLLEEDPTNEEAHVALARRMARAGDVRGGLRQLERLDRALRAELGTVPGPEAVRLRSSLQAALGHDAGTAGGSGRALVGRQEALATLGRAMVRARAGRGTTVLVTGPTGVGKSAVLAVVARSAQDQDWRIGRGAASSVEGPWAYSAVLEALADLCRHHPTILDGLDDAYRTEIDRALSGRALPWSGETAHQRLFIAAAELVRLAAAGHGLLLVIEDLHEADEASLRLVHYLARCAVDAPVMLLLTARAAPGSPIPAALASLLARGVGSRLELAPLTLDQAMDLLAERHPDLRRSAAERLWTISGGLPFTLLESAVRRPPPVRGGAAAAGGPAGIALASAVSTLPPSAGLLVSGSRCSGWTSAPTRSSPSRTGTRSMPSPTSRRRSTPWCLSPARRGTASATRRCGTRCSRQRRPTDARRCIATSLIGSTPSRRHPPGWPGTSSPAGIRRRPCPTCSGPSVRSAPSGPTAMRST